jgi:hypothetical protein
MPISVFDDQSIEISCPRCEVRAELPAELSMADYVEEVGE